MESFLQLFHEQFSFSACEGQNQTQNLNIFFHTNCKLLFVARNGSKEIGGNSLVGNSTQMLSGWGQHLTQESKTEDTRNFFFQ